jgi:alkyl hydroperoxide reductase subunit AhpC
LSDLTKSIAADYGVLNEGAGFSLRGTFLIDKNQILRHVSINDTNVGRNMDEYLRLVDAFNFSAEHGDNCPAKWKGKGDPTMVGSHDDPKTKEYFKKHLKK